jgi:hypothetical protein
MNEELKQARKAFDEANYGSWHLLYFLNIYLLSSMETIYDNCVFCGDIPLSRHVNERWRSTTFQPLCFQFYSNIWAFNCLPSYNHTWITCWLLMTTFKLKCCKPCSSFWLFT